MARRVSNHKMAAHAPATLEKLRALRAHKGQKRVNGYRLTFRLLRLGLPSPTVTASGFRDFVHPRANRFLTARELARLQTFPDDWVFVGHRLDSFSTKRDVPLPQVAQIGNAVPPELAFALAQSIRRQLFRDFSRTVAVEVGTRIPAILRNLRHFYPSDNLGNKKEPLDELVFIMLSRRTQDRQYRSGYAGLRKAFPRWQAVLDAPRRRVVRVLSPLGFGRQRTAHLLGALRQVKRDFGELSLARMKKWDTSRALHYLISLPGVNEKTAKCVLMYSLKRQVFPVDTHVLRTCQRIGLISPTLSEYRAARPLEMLVPPSLRADFHVALVQHGRAVCHAGVPSCEQCPIRWLCEYGRRSFAEDQAAVAAVKKGAGRSTLRN
jgi:endonuclease III